jgi:hypothetical protein
MQWLVKFNYLYIGIDPTKPDPLKAVTDWYNDDTIMNSYDGKNNNNL